MIRILLDECLPVKLKYGFREINPEFVISTVTDQKWTGIKNGELLYLAQQEFDIFVTSDQNLRYQQKFSKYSIAVVLLQATFNRYKDLLGFIESTSETILFAETGKLYKIPTVNR